MKKTTPQNKFQTPHEIARTSAPKEKAAAKKPAAKAAKPRMGKLGNLFGFSVVSVIRAMGKAGWDCDTARLALDKAGVTAAKHTLKVGLKRGRDGQKFIAPVSGKQLDSLRITVKSKKLAKAKQNC